MLPPAPWLGEASLTRAGRSTHRNGDGEPEDVRDDTDANHDQRLNNGWSPTAGDDQVRHEAQHSDESTNDTTDSEQQDRQRGQDSQDDRDRGSGPMPYAVDLHDRVRISEEATYSGFNRTTGHCRQRILALARPGAGAPPTLTAGRPQKALVVTTIGPATPSMLTGSVFTGVNLEKPAQPRLPSGRRPSPVAPAATPPLQPRELRPPDTRPSRGRGHQNGRGSARASLHLAGAFRDGRSGPSRGQIIPDRRHFHIFDHEARQPLMTGQIRAGLGTRCVTFVAR